MDKHNFLFTGDNDAIAVHEKFIEENKETFEKIYNSAFESKLDKVKPFNLSPETMNKSALIGLIVSAVGAGIIAFNSQIGTEIGRVIGESTGGEWKTIYAGVKDVMLGVVGCSAAAGALGTIAGKTVAKITEQAINTTRKIKAIKSTDKNAYNEKVAGMNKRLQIEEDTAYYQFLCDNPKQHITGFKVADLKREIQKQIIDETYKEVANAELEKEMPLLAAFSKDGEMALKKQSEKDYEDAMKELEYL
jgi:hypothetical protein